MPRFWKSILPFIVVIDWLSVAKAQVQILPEADPVTAIEAKGGKVYRTFEGKVDIVDLKGNQVTDADLAVLKALPTVRILNLDGSQVTDQGLEQLLELPNLEEVSLRFTAVSPAAAQSLKDRHPKVFFVELSSTGFRLQEMALSIVLIPAFLCGLWLVRLTLRKRPLLSPLLYVRGLACGLLLIVASLVLLLVCLIRALGYDYHLSAPFG